MIDHLIIKVFFSILRSNEGSVMCKGLFNLKNIFVISTQKNLKMESKPGAWLGVGARGMCLG